MRTRAFLLAMLAVPLSAACLDGQAAVEPCSYETCSIRVEPGWWGPKVVRGAKGETAARLGLFGSELERLVARSDSAARYAHSYRTQHTTGTLLGIAGAALTAISIAQWDGPLATDGGESNDDGVAVGVTAGTAIAIIGVIIELGAQRSLARSVWWYNRDLPR